MATIFGALPFILQNGTTADATQVMADFNKIISDGNANAAENGVNSSITALLGLTTPIPVAGGSSTHFIGATSGGTAAAQTVATTTPANWTLTKGFELSFTPGFSATGATTLAVAGGAALAVRKPTPTGPVPLVANDWVAGQMVTVIYDGTAYITQSELAYPALFATQASLASAATADLGTIGSHNVLITGTTTITSFGSTALTASPIFLIQFQNSLHLTFNGTSMILPGGTDIQTQANDFAMALYLGSGNWQIMAYWPALPVPGIQPTAGSFKNLIVRATADTVLSFTADELILEDASGRALRVTGVSLSNTITGSGANGLDTGVLAAPNFYSVWAIYNPLTNTLASLVSLSAGAPTMPSGYTFRMRVGWVKYDTTNRLWRSVQQGRSYQIIVGTFPAQAPVISSGAVGTFSLTSPVLSSVALTSFVPSTAAKVYLNTYRNWKGAGAADMLIAPNVNWGGTNNGPEGSNGQVWPITIYNSVVAHFRTELILEALSLGMCSDAAGGVVAAMGWEDNI